MAISKSNHLAFVRLQAQLRSMIDVVGKLHGGEAGIAKEDVTDHMAAVVNKVLKAAADFLGNDSPLKDAITLPLAKLPTHGDVLVFAGQFLAALEAVKVQHVQFRHGRWYWLVLKDGSTTEVEYVLVDPSAKAAAEDAG